MSEAGVCWVMFKMAAPTVSDCIAGMSDKMIFHCFGRDSVVHKLLVGIENTNTDG